MPNARCFGVDYSEQMIAAARRLRDDFPALKGRVDFATGDVTALEQACGGRRFDLVITDRCLINLESVERQAAAFSSIARRVKPDGLYLAIENFNEGQRNMNRARQAVGLPEISVRWHSLYFRCSARWPRLTFSYWKSGISPAHTISQPGLCIRRCARCVAKRSITGMRYINSLLTCHGPAISARSGWR